ncbi:MAG TPA: hypothetical protein VKT78_15120 [Fimbriimonadaceae bacterium]|nr:hypothetical protein [Fimbriimonadaceae bacterium]
MKAARERGLMPSTGIGVGLLASILLALLTISVFYVLQDYGPESAVRKYNEGVLTGDLAAVNQISTQPVDPNDADWLRAYVQSFLRTGGRLRLMNMDRTPDRSVAYVEYVEPEPPSIQFLFVVRKQNHIWRISPTETRRVIESFRPHGI